MNKDVQQVLRKCRKQGARIVPRGNSGAVEVHGPNGFYIVHTSLSLGATTAVLKRELRKIGFEL